MHIYKCRILTSGHKQCSSQGSYNIGYQSKNDLLALQSAKPTYIRLCFSILTGADWESCTT